MHWIDPDFLPLISGTLMRFTPTPEGEVDGFILDDGRQIHLPPHLTPKVQAGLHSGDVVQVRGVKLRGLDVVTAVKVTTAEGLDIENIGPGPDHAKPKHKEHKAPKAEKADKPRLHQSAMLSGVVATSLHGLKGELHGAMLQDGVVVRIGHKEALTVAALLRPGAAIEIRGERIETPFGTVVEADTVTATKPASNQTAA